jgi:hypothetical protein
VAPVTAAMLVFPFSWVKRMTTLIAAEVRTRRQPTAFAGETAAIPGES